MEFHFFSKFETKYRVFFAYYSICLEVLILYQFNISTYSDLCSVRFPPLLTIIAQLVHLLFAVCWRCTTDIKTVFFVRYETKQKEKKKKKMIEIEKGFSSYGKFTSIPVK